jgi:predicted RNA binding protein YcfA (HicA-like mRNA interferase family)
MPRMVREVIRIERDGWVLDRTQGNQRQFRHPVKPGVLTIAGKRSDDLARGAENSIRKEAGLK